MTILLIFTNIVSTIMVNTLIRNMLPNFTK